MGNWLHLKVDAGRFAVIYKETAAGSEPEIRFYIMAAVSTLIASFGLVTNSMAVIIGAMLVAPLMTPIFGISLALVRGDTHLFQRAVRAEVIGVVAAVVMAFLLGLMLSLLNPYGDITPEMLARTKPNLWDLFVAILAGFAGTYALIDEKISPALPGVAVATAIVPPLANSGLHLAYGAYQGALGSFLLFVANFISILIISSILFYKAGMARDYGSIKKVDIARRFGLAALCFLFIAALLGNTLYQMIQERKLRNAVNSALVSELSNYTTMGIDNLVIRRAGDKHLILAQVHSPNQIAPNQIKKIEDDLTAQLGIPVELIIRTIKTNDIASTGSSVISDAQSLEGFFMSRLPSPEVRKIRHAEQVAKAFLDKRIGLDVTDVEYLEFLRGPIILVTVTGVRELTPAEVLELENLVKERTGDQNLDLVIRFMNIHLHSNSGPVHHGWIPVVEPTPQQLRAKNQMETAIRTAFADNDLYLVENINPVITKDEYDFLVELSTAAAYTRSDLIRLQGELSALADKPVKLYVWLNQGAVMTDEGLVSYNRLTQAQMEKYGPEAKKQIQRVIESTR